MSARAESVFRNRNFSTFYAGQALSYVGDGLRLLAIPLLVYHLTGSALTIGVTYALELGPFALFGLVGGSLADRVDRRKLMIACDAVRFAILLTFAIGYARGALSLGLLYTGIVVMSIAAAVFMGGQASSIPYLVGKDRATAAAAALLAAEQTTSMVLPPIGGAIFALAGPLPALVANALTYLTSQASLALTEGLGPERPSGLPTWREIVADVRTGFAFAFADRTMRSLTIAGSFINFLGFMCAAVFIPYLKRDFGASDAVVGYALGCSAIGALAGSWIAGRIPTSWPFGRTLIYAYLIDGFFFIPVVFTHDLRVAVVFLAVSNGCVLFEIAQIVGWRMRVTPQELVGRVFGVVRLVALIGTVPGALIGGAIGDHFGNRVAMGVSCFGYIVVACIIAAVPSIRKERR